MLTLQNAPLGTTAPSVQGGHWIRTNLGWRWCTGATFPSPGGDWNGDLIPPGEGFNVTIHPEAVDRDELGNWMHPALLPLFGDRENVPPAEWQAWRDAQNIETMTIAMELDLDETDPAYVRHFDKCQPGSVGWNPEPPGVQWRMLSLQDTEDGPVVTWYRHRDSPSQ
ncbi:hypothetical protein [Marinobacter shengliensis]|uniref:hypothetical protein n=1 Tax=Marinobacter shengliensis TaxID=1389223 RepID=UPI001D17FE67|nr:hypothetical protein [Marinobacter shengliensis]